MNKIDNTRTAVVDPDYFWKPMSSCPLGHKVQLLNLGGVAVYGTVSLKTIDDWKGWAPCPKIPEDMK